MPCWDLLHLWTVDSDPQPPVVTMATIIPFYIVSCQVTLMNVLKWADLINSDVVELLDDTN